MVQSNILYHSRRFNLLKQIIFVVGGGWVVGGSDVKMGCTIYWKIFPVKNVRGVYISVVRSFCWIITTTIRLFIVIGFLLIPTNDNE